MGVIVVLFSKKPGLRNTLATLHAAIHSGGRPIWPTGTLHHDNPPPERSADVRAILVGGHVIVLDEPSAAVHSDASRS